jgi:hypothetical protein
VRSPYVAISVLASALAAATAVSHTARARDGQPPRPCASAEYHQFDFFAGDWDTFDAGKPETVVARNTVTPMVDGCALREVYREPGGHSGESFSTYDAGRGLWWFDIVFRRHRQ